MSASGDDLQYSAEQHVMRMTTPLEKTLLLRTLRVEEKISEPFLIEAEVFCASSEVDFKAILGQDVSIHAELAGGSSRWFHGVVSRFAQGETVGSVAMHSVTEYRIEIVPRFQFFSHTKNCRIFPDKSVKEILETIFRERQMLDYRCDLKPSTRSSLPIDYCVQYNESDLDFCSRMMEEAGLGYYFEHEEDRHRLVVFDRWAQHPRTPSDDTVRYWPLQTEGSAGLDTRRITSFEVSRAFHAGKFTTSDFNPEDPGDHDDPGGALLSTTTLPSDAIGCDDRFEIFEFPGEYKRVLDGGELTRQLSCVAEQESVEIVGTSSCPGFTAGHTFEMTEHPRTGFNNEYLITGIEHVIRQPVSVVGKDDASVSYEGRITCLPYRDDVVPFVPAEKTPKPRVYGIQTATVVSKDGLGLDVDAQGRILVKFSWDRSNQTTSCRVRVSQKEAGSGWGGMATPHVGHEVLVSFLEGDPDRPIVVGRVYNARNMPPLEQVNTTRTIISDHGGVVVELEGGPVPSKS